MKKIVFLLLIALCLPIGLMAQSYDDDLYFIPSKEEKKETVPVRKEPAQREVTTNIYTAPGTAVVIQDRKGNTRDVDEYNRRYDARDNDFEMDNDTLYIREKAQSDLDGEWVNGEFEGSQDDYEYAERIIRFRNPRFAVSISSPFYWDVVYGTNPWEWNVYTDGLYAYAFPTFSNPLWWDWRYNSYGPGWGWGWSRPYYGWGGYYPGYWGGWYGGWHAGWHGGWHGGYWGDHWGHHHGYYPGWGGGGHYWGNSTYTNRRSYGSLRGSSSVRRADGGRSQSVRRGSTVDAGRRSSSTGRVVGTRSSSRPGTVTRSDASSTRRGTYTRPSSTRSSSSSYDSSRGSSVRSSGSTTRSSGSSVRSNGSSVRSGSSSDVSTRRSTSSAPSYNRGSSTSPSRSYSSGSTTRRSTPSSSSSRSYSSPGSSSRSSGSYSGGGSSSRSSSGGGGGSTRSSRR